MKLLNAILVVSATPLFCSMMSLPLHAEHRNSLRPCAHNLIYMTALSYACSYIVNTDAEDSNSPQRVVTAKTNGDSVEYSSQADKEICGRLGYPTPDAVAPLASAATTTLQRDIFVSLVSQLRPVINIGRSIAEIEFTPESESKIIAQTENDASEQLRLSVDDLLAKFTAAIREVPKSHAIQEDVQTCSVAIDGSRVFLPRPTPPDLSTLRKWPGVEKRYLTTAARLERLLPQKHLSTSDSK